MSQVNPMIVEASEEMEKAAGENLDFFRHIIDGIDDLGEAVIRNILNRLPAKSFASAACVSRSWNTICNSILSSPKLSSDVSFNPSLEKALNEVVEKVLMEPIRPHFVLASIGPCFILQAALQRIEGIFGSKIPIIINVAEGVIGRDVRTDKFVEVQWALSAAKMQYSWSIDTEPTATCGMILTVGFLPGLKVHLVPLFQSEGPQSLLVDKFVMDIREVASAFSHSSSPAGIMLFAPSSLDFFLVLESLLLYREEDICIVSSWLNISKDAIHGSDQKSSRFWARIDDRFITNGGQRGRTEQSVKHRWGDINTQCSKFISYLNQIEHRHQSSQTDHGRLEEARKLYAANNNRRGFKFEHCLDLLKYERKWLDTFEKNKQTRATFSNVDGVPTSSEAQGESSANKD